MPSARQEAGQRRVAQLLREYGCIPQEAPDGPIVTKFGPLALAQAIEQELNRCADMGWPKLTLHMDVPDALALAKFLRVAVSALQGKGL
jgi:hypothetical protein